MAALTIDKTSDKTSARTTPYTKWRARLSERFGENRPARSAPKDGGIDLESTVIGVMTVGIVGSIISATVFAVIPWAQAQAEIQGR